LAYGSARSAMQKLLEKHTSYNKLKMVAYKCFHCGKTVKQDYIKKRVRCPYCGSKILYKPRIISSTVKAI